MTVFKVGRPFDMQVGSILETSLTSTRSIGSKKIYPSNSGMCTRKSVAMTLLPNSASETITVTNQMYFAIGSAIEDVVVKSLDQAGVLLAREFTVKRNWKAAEVSGRVDAIIQLDGVIIPIEIKSCGSKIPSTPRLPHRAQLETYMICTGLHYGLIVYVSRTVADFRGRLKYRIFELALDNEESIKEVASKLADTLIFANASVLPPIPFDNNKECRFCPLIEYCWEPKKDEYELEKFKKDDGELSSLYDLSATLTERILENQEKYMTETTAAIFAGKMF